jgi:hypothetical protein
MTLTPEEREAIQARLEDARVLNIDNIGTPAYATFDDSLRDIPALLSALKAAEERAEKAEARAQSINGDWPEDFTHENGNYLNKCCYCETTFKGHKRRVVCKVCHGKQATESDLTALRARVAVQEEALKAISTRADFDMTVSRRTWRSWAQERALGALQDACPCHVASDGDPKICGRCGIHIDSLR